MFLVVESRLEISIVVPAAAFVQHVCQLYQWAIAPYLHRKHVLDMSQLPQGNLRAAAPLLRGIA